MDQFVVIANVKNPVEKPFVFRGVEFKRWRQKMLCNLTTLNLAQCLTSEGPVLPAESIKAVTTWTENEFLCKNCILNALDDSLYNMYLSFKSPKELWEFLDKMYKSEAESARKFIVGKFLNFEMSDADSVVKKVAELQVIITNEKVQNRNFIEEESY